MLASEKLTADRPQNNTTRETYIAKNGQEILVGDVPWLKFPVEDNYSKPGMYEALRLQGKIAQWNSQLAQGYENQAPPLVDRETKALTTYNSVSREIYDSHPAMLHWRAHLVPSAMALLPMQQPESSKLYDGTEIDDGSRMFYTHALDAIAIRSRATIMKWVAADALSRRMEQGGADGVRVISVASGTAIPVIDAVRSLDGQVHLDLVDIDERAHDMAAQHLAGDSDLSHVAYKLWTRDIRPGLIVRDRMVDELGEQQADFVDAMGIFEYIPNDPNARREGRAVSFLRNLQRLVKPGGTLVFGNMLTTHPQLEFNKYGIGWPHIYPRSREELVEIIAEAGIDSSQVTVYEAQDAGFDDGVYAVVEVRKPLEVGDA